MRSDRHELAHVVMVLGWLGIASINASIWATLLWWVAGPMWAVAMWVLAMAGTTLSLGLLAASADNAVEPH